MHSIYSYIYVYVCLLTVFHYHTFVPDTLEVSHLQQCAEFVICYRKIDHCNLGKGEFNDLRIFFRAVKQENGCCICCGIASESLRLQRCLFLTGLTTVPRFLAGMKEQPLRPRGATSTVWYREPLPAKAGWMLLHLLGKFARQVP